MKLTKRAIDSFRYNGGWDVRWDDAVPGFGIRIYPTGKKAFVLSYRHQGRKRLMVLGRYGADFTLDQARKKASASRVQVREGADPLEEKQRTAAGETFADFEKAYLERHAKVHKKTWKADEGRLARNTPNGWKNRKVASITQSEIAARHNQIGAEKPYEANRWLEIIRKAFNLAPIWGFLPKDASNPANGIQKFKERKRKRWVTPAEIPMLAEAIDKEQNVYARATVWLYLLTGLRKTELLEARHDDVDWERGVLRLPDTKSDEEQYATLNSAALAIIQAIPKVERNPYLLPSGKDGHLVNVDKPWRRIRTAATIRVWESEDGEPAELISELKRQLERAPKFEDITAAAEKQGIALSTGFQDVRMHDLRRTVGSWMSSAEVDLNRIKTALRHANISTTLIYALLGQDPVREAFEDHGKRIMEAAGRARPVSVDQNGA